ncbi:GNAT family N-acetyltransferase [Pelagicoccus sp. SDUM812005]|uniref:GNAT family N-acetyltransferase n=1 Tax=Pelagicoccus sp. SDUM812005 TaxID=3041257 RepID=UPI00280E7C93|nr:GNAT family N-acetyltransferase [Pelagicoccus sp. SDUM812005]MDQ8182238.1 GNAT family N-acetyltransferase [Pelagicoccus sp. SDUM812005]
MTDSPAPLLHDADNRKFYTENGAHLLYSRDGNTLAIEHVFVPHHLRGQSLAARLVKQAVAYSDSIGTKINPLCSYAKAFLERNPELRQSLAAPFRPAHPQSNTAERDV